MSIFSNQIQPISSSVYACDICQYKSRKKSNFEEHLLTRKHQSAMGSKLEINQIQQNPAKPFCCQNCGKAYKDNSGLWRHKKKCYNNQDDMTIDGINIKDKDALVIHLLKQNSDLQNKLIELSMEKTITTNNINCHNTNNAFNLNFFLNETCKNAMNITDFVSNIKLELNDLENTGRRGYIEGITNIIVKNLNNLEQCFRPIHCSDVKREVLYIKDNDKWTKETDDKPILTKAIKVIANENIKQINKWKNLNPDCTSSDSKNNNLYLKIVSNSMNGLTKEEGDRNISKIISNVAKEVVIEK